MLRISTVLFAVVLSTHASPVRAESMALLPYLFSPNDETPDTDWRAGDWLAYRIECQIAHANDTHVFSCGTLLKEVESADTNTTYIRYNVELLDNRTIGVASIDSLSGKLIAFTSNGQTTKEFERVPQGALKPEGEEPNSVTVPARTFAGAVRYTDIFCLPGCESVLIECGAADTPPSDAETAAFIDQVCRIKTWRDDPAMVMRGKIRQQAAMWTSNGYLLLDIQLLAQSR